MDPAPVPPDSQWPDEAEQTVHAIRTGAVDAFVVESPEGHCVYALQVADLPYSTLVERMQQPASILNANGELLYCNPSLAQLLGNTCDLLVGASLRDFVDPLDHARYDELRRGAQDHAQQGELHLASAGKLIPAHFSFSSLSRDGAQTGVLITDVTLQHEQLKLAARLQQVQDEERRRLARELHDSVGQTLAAMSMNIDRVARELPTLSPEAAQCAKENMAMLQQVIREIRTISHLLHPPLLDEIGLSSALQWLVTGFSRRSNISTTLQVPPDWQRLPQDVEIAIFRIVQECLTNVHRHSGSSECSVTITEDGEQLLLEIRDKGRGMAEQQSSALGGGTGLGLRGIRERIQDLGGNITLVSNQAGTTVSVRLPVKRR